MALSPGTRLGSYEVTALIGKGGMGEVYRARDTKLRLGVPSRFCLKAGHAERLCHQIERGYGRSRLTTDSR